MDLTLVGWIAWTVLMLAAGAFGYRYYQTEWADPKPAARPSSPKLCRVEDCRKHAKWCGAAHARKGAK